MNNRKVVVVLILVSAVIIIAGIIPYWGVITKGFFLSDDFYYLSRPKIDSIWSELIIYPWRHFIRPVVTSLWHVEAALFGFRPEYFHALNIFINCMNAVFLFLLIYLINGNITAGLLAGLSFAVFPIHPEAVSWLSGSFDTICAFFFLGALVSFGIYLRRQSTAAYAVAALFCLLALYSKEEAIVLPMVLLAYDLLFGPRKRPLPRLKHHIPFFSLLAFYLTLRLSIIGIGGYGSRHTDISLPSVLKNIFIDAPFRLLYPVNREVYSGNPAWIFYVSIGLLFVFFLLRVVGTGRKDYRLLFFSLAFTVISLLPVLGILDIKDNLLGSRYLYLPSAGYCLLMGWMVPEFNGQRKKQLFAVLLVVMVAGFFGYLLYNNNIPWVGASERMRTVYSEVERQKDSSNKNLIVFFLDTKEEAFSYKGAFFLAFGYTGYNLLMSEPGKTVCVLPLHKVKDNPRGLRDYAFEREVKPGNKVDWPLYSEAEAIMAGIKKPEEVGVNYIAVKWDEETRGLKVLYKSF